MDGTIATLIYGAPWLAVVTGAVQMDLSTKGRHACGWSCFSQMKQSLEKKRDLAALCNGSKWRLIPV